ARGVAHGPQHWMDHEVQGETLAVHFHRHRVDEERHVVVDDLHDGVRAVPAVLAGRGVIGADRRLAAREPAAELEVARGRTREIPGAARGELFGIDLRVIEALEPLGEIRLRWLRLGFHPWCCSTLGAGGRNGNSRSAGRAWLCAFNLLDRIRTNLSF